MAKKCRTTRIGLLGVVLGLSLLGTGCLAPHGHVPPVNNLPNELSMTALPPHILEPGDTIVMTLRSLLLPKPPYRIEVLDQLMITIEQGDPQTPIRGLVFVVEPEGTVRLGGNYPSIKVVGLSLEEAGLFIRKTLMAPPEKGGLNLKDPQVLVTLEEGRSLEAVPDNATVRPDGTISLGGYGAVHIAGLTEQEARVRIEEHLAEFLITPELYLEVSIGNLKSFYFIVQRSSGEELVSKIQLTGREHVLDIMAATAEGGFPFGGNRARMWIARPAPADAECDQILPIRWADIVMKGRTATNYQLLPGDRLYVSADPFLRANDFINRVATPFVTVSTLAQTFLSAEEIFRVAINSGGIFSGGFFGFGGFPGFGFGF